MLPATLDRLLNYDEADTNTKLIEAVTKIHLGTASALDIQFVCAHRWQELLLVKTAGGSVELRSEIIGRRALQILRERSPSPHADAAALYSANNFQASLRALGESGRLHHKLLYLAANMMHEAFGDAPQSLYFGPTVKWREIGGKAVAAAKECTDPSVRQEFEAWMRIEPRTARETEPGNDGHR